MIKNLILKDKMGQVIRFFRCETDKVCLVYRKNKGRLDLCSSPDFFGKDSVVLLDTIKIDTAQQTWSVPFIQGVLEVCDEVSNTRSSLPLPDFSKKDFWMSSAFVLGAYAIFMGGLYGLSKLQHSEEKKKIEPQVVKIIKPPTVVQPEKVLIGSNQMFMRSAKQTVKKKVLKKSLKKMGALSVLGSLSKKDSTQRAGLNLGASKVSAGPGFRAVAGQSASGGVQDSIYSKGMITSALGSGGNIRGGGGHGTKGTGQAGGQAGYGELTLIGSGGMEDLSSSSVLDQQGGGFDFGIIDREIVKQIGHIRQCYDTALKVEPDLKGLFKVYFVISPVGKVNFSKVHPSSPVRSSEISSCILSLINKIKFPVQLMSAVGINYAFDLDALDIEGG